MIFNSQYALTLPRHLNRVATLRSSLRRVADILLFCPSPSFPQQTFTSSPIPMKVKHSSFNFSNEPSLGLKLESCSSRPLFPSTLSSFSKRKPTFLDFIFLVQQDHGLLNRRFLALRALPSNCLADEGSSHLFSSPLLSFLFFSLLSFSYISPLSFYRSYPSTIYLIPSPSKLCVAFTGMLILTSLLPLPQFSRPS